MGTLMIETMTAADLRKEQKVILGTALMGRKRAGWTEKMRALAIGEWFAFDLDHYDTINGIRQRMRRKGEALLFIVSQGRCERIA